MTGYLIKLSHSQAQYMGEYIGPRNGILFKTKEGAEKTWGAKKDKLPDSCIVKVTLSPVGESYEKG